MKRITFSKRGNIVPVSLVASALVGFFAVMSFLVLPFETGVVANMSLSPASKTLVVGETFTVDVIVESQVPVNVFAGELFFDKHTLQVESIDYNTSIADLWAEEPWYSNGDGTLKFIGGTTQRGGYTGSDSLIKITFRTINTGVGALAIADAQILQYDGLGTDAVLAEPIDALFTVEAQPVAGTNVLQQTAVPSRYAVVPTIPSTDLNNDGKQGIADVSIFLLHVGSKDPLFDFNMDGEVGLTDLNILLGS
jgi:hypothetical protein